MDYPTLAEHINPILGILAVCVSAAAFLFWRMYTKTERKVDQLCHAVERLKEEHNDHLIECAKLYPTMVSSEAYKRFKDDIWSELNNHSHSPEGKVIRSKW